MNPKYKAIEGDAVLLENVRHVGAMYDKAWWRPTRWSVTVDFMDGDCLEWDCKSQQEAEALRDVIKGWL